MLILCKVRMLNVFLGNIYTWMYICSINDFTSVINIYCLAYYCSFIKVKLLWQQNLINSLKSWTPSLLEFLARLLVSRSHLFHLLVSLNIACLLEFLMHVLVNHKLRLIYHQGWWSNGKERIPKWFGVWRSQVWIPKWEALGLNSTTSALDLLVSSWGWDNSYGSSVPSEPSG